MTTKLPTAKAPKMPKLPKSLGACVDLAHDLREKRLTMQKEVDAVEAQEKFVREHIIKSVPKGDSGAVGKRFKGVVLTEDIPQVEDWDVFYRHISKTKSFDLLNRAVNRKAVSERWADKKAVPGVKVFKAVKLSITKV
jgi:hypothetical protein